MSHLPLPSASDAGARAVAVVIAFALCAAPAGAAIIDPPPFRSFTPSTVRTAGDGLSYRTSNRERNVVTIRRSGDGGVVLRDSVPVIAVDGPCRNVTFTEVRCPRVTPIRVRVGMNDRVRCVAAVACNEQRTAGGRTDVFARVGSDGSAAPQPLVRS